MLQRILILEVGRVFAKSARGWKLEGRTRRAWHGAERLSVHPDSWSRVLTMVQVCLFKGFEIVFGVEEWREEGLVSPRPMPDPRGSCWLPQMVEASEKARHSGDFLCVFLFKVLTATVSSNSKGEGWQTQKKRGWMAWQVRMEELHAKAVTIDGRKEWSCRFCSETNVWTRSKCRRCQTNVPSVLQGKYKQAVSIKAGGSGWFGLVFTWRV